MRSFFKLFLDIVLWRRGHRRYRKSALSRRRRGFDPP
jgi:hypothetical protein